MMKSVTVKIIPLCDADIRRTRGVSGHRTPDRGKPLAVRRGLSLMCAGLLSLCADAAKVWGVTDFGAREGDALQTAALQRAIDACFTAGGGEVRDCVLDSACSAFRFGGTDVLIENCRGAGPTPYGFRGSLPLEARRLALNDGARTPHSLRNAFLYYCDFRAAIRRTPTSNETRGQDRSS